jgi:hypothetical protein
MSGNKSFGLTKFVILTLSVAKGKDPFFKIFLKKTTAVFFMKE